MLYETYRAEDLEFPTLFKNKNVIEYLHFNS